MELGRDFGAWHAFKPISSCVGRSLHVLGIISSSEEQVPRIPTSQCRCEIQVGYHPQTTWHQKVVPSPIYTSSWEPLQGALLASEDLLRDVMLENHRMGHSGILYFQTLFLYWNKG